MSSLTERKQEIETKLGQLRQRLVAHQLDGVQIASIANAAWITAGAATYVNEAADYGAASILVTQDRAIVLTDMIEAPRLQHDESLADLGFEFVIEPWYQRGGLTAPLLKGKRIGHDGQGDGLALSADLLDLRSVLQPTEVDRLRQVGQRAAAAVDEATRLTKPGDTEHQLAGRLANAARSRGGTAVVNLIASDERIYNFRHPLPTAKVVEKYAMLVLCFRRHGLIVSVTRLIHFGAMPSELREKELAVARLDAKVILGTQAGKTMGDMFALLKQAYADEGYPEAIEQHHQGGSAGYAAREVIATPNNPTLIRLNQVFAWNPSVKGCKSEDTVLLNGQGKIEVLTKIPSWPTHSIVVGNQTILRPAILEVD